MADPTLLAGIVGLVNQTLLYLQTTAPTVALVVAAVARREGSGSTPSEPDTGNKDLRYRN